MKETRRRFTIIEKANNRYRRLELLKDEMMVNLIFADNLRDSRCIDNTYWNIRSKLVYSEANNVYMYIYKNIRNCDTRKENISFPSIYIYIHIRLVKTPRYEYASEWFRERHTKKEFLSNLNLVARAMVR